MSKENVISKVKRQIRYDEFHHDEESLSITVDRYRRHDHGGGEDGDDWLDDHEIDEDFRQGKKEHQSKLAQVNEILEEEGFKPNAEFELGEKGHFSIEVIFRKK